MNKFTKLHESINQGIRPLNLGRRKRLTWYPFLHILTSNTMSPIFGTCVYFFFYKRIKFEKGKEKQNCPRKKRHNFLIRKIIKIRRHLLVSQFGQAAADLELEMHVQIANFLLSRNRETKIRRHPSVIRLSNFPRRRLNYCFGMGSFHFGIV